VNSIGADTEFKVRDLRDDVKGDNQAQCSKVYMASNQVTSESSHVELTKINIDQDEVQLKLANLHYLKVNILDSDYNWRVLHDSGSEVDVIDRCTLMQCCVPNEVVGNIALYALWLVLQHRHS